MRLIPTFGEVLPLLIVTFVMAMVITVGLTPLVRRLAIRLQTVDAPNHRRVNASPVPRGGGIAVAISFLTVALAILFVNDRLQMVNLPFTISPQQLIGLFVGGAVATVIGFLDDYFQLRARWQLLGQVALAVLAIAAGITVTYLNNPFGPGSIVLEGPFAIGVTTISRIGSRSGMTPRTVARAHQQPGC
jgi:UDP-GlcNAc:undecaprenyl-phosphate GlcNAc-1-phosphate transferase